MIDFLYDVLVWEGWRYVTMAAVVVGFTAATTFVVALQAEAGWDWWRNPFGRFLMTRKILLSCLFALVMVNSLIPVWPGRRMVTALLMLAFAVQTFVPYRLLMRAQEDAHSRKEKRHDAR
jgi:hypothetical protein